MNFLANQIKIAKHTRRWREMFPMIYRTCCTTFENILIKIYGHLKVIEIFV